MTLNIELTPAQETRLLMAARMRGTDPQTLARNFVLERLPEMTDTTSVTSSTGTPEATLPAQAAPNMNRRDPELVARVKQARGKFAHIGEGLASEQLHRERQADKAKEEAQIRGYQP